MCWYCGSPVNASEPIGRSLRCENCGRDIRSCKNCRFFSPGSSGDCREPQANSDPPGDRERSNFCDWFSLNPKFRSSGAGREKDMDRARSARSAFDDLFSAHG
ncbi:MAG: hypothetical protein LBB77_01815 [Treponema sp.]|nr:hypothetical protein [Treponema sp.]